MNDNERQLLIEIAVRLIAINDTTSKIKGLLFVVIAMLGGILGTVLLRVQ